MPPPQSVSYAVVSIVDVEGTRDWGRITHLQSRESQIGNHPQRSAALNSARAASISSPLIVCPIRG